MASRGMLIISSLVSLTSAATVGAYFESWSSRCIYTAAPVHLDLGRVAPFIDNIFLAFADPKEKFFDPQSANSNGLMFPDKTPKYMKTSISMIKDKNPNAKVFLSVGGATYPFPAQMSPDQIKAIIQYVDFYNLDGIEIDYENRGNCKYVNNGPKCETDQHLTSIIEDFGKALKNHPRKIHLSAAVFSVGAYYYGDYLNAKPISDDSGMWVNPLKQAGHYLDNINVMSYDAGKYTFTDTTIEGNHGQFNPIEAYKAYKTLFSGTVNIGLEAPTEAWGGNILVSDHIRKVADQVKLDPKDGLFMWSLQKKNAGKINNKTLMELICASLNHKDCSDDAKPLPWALMF